MELEKLASLIVTWEDVVTKLAKFDEETLLYFFALAAENKWPGELPRYIEEYPLSSFRGSPNPYRLFMFLEKELGSEKTNYYWNVVHLKAMTPEEWEKWWAQYSYEPGQIRG